MSEENQADTETVSESPATATTQDSSSEQYIAESKKYRKRAQDAETRLAKLETSLATAETDKLKEKENFKALYDKEFSKNESLTANADKWSKYEEAKRNSLLENHPEEEKESLSKLDLETLEYVTNKINSTKTNVPEVAGNSRQDYKTPPKDWTTLSPEDQKNNWDDIVKSAIKKSKNNVGTMKT
jgi:hypothetical protein